MDMDRDEFELIIRDHDEHPRNFGILDRATHTFRASNPVCGDTYDIFLVVDDRIIEEISFSGRGCAISKASASIMTTMLKGEDVREAERMCSAWLRLLTDGTPSESRILEMGDLEALLPVRSRPLRVVCAGLVWQAVKSGIPAGLDEFHKGE